MHTWGKMLNVQSCTERGGNNITWYRTIMYVFTHERRNIQRSNVRNDVDYIDLKWEKFTTRKQSERHWLISYIHMGKCSNHTRTAMLNASIGTERSNLHPNKQRDIDCIHNWRKKHSMHTLGKMLNASPCSGRCKQHPHNERDVECFPSCPN